MRFGSFKYDPIKKHLLRFCRYSFFLFVSVLYAQSLDDQIYEAVDQLVLDASLEKTEFFQKREVEFGRNAKSSEDYLALLVLQCNLGYYQRRLGATDKSISLYEKGWKNYQDHQLSGYDIIEFCLKPLGNLYTIKGQYTQAENSIKTYIHLAQKQQNVFQEHAGILNLSVVYYSSGRFNDAVNILNGVLVKNNIDSKQREQFKNNLAANLVALKDYKKAQNVLQFKSSDSSFESSQSFRNLAQIAIEQHDYSLAESHLNRAETLMVKEDFTTRELAKLYVDKAALALQLGIGDEVQKILHQALGVLLPTNNFGKPPQKDMLYAENTFISIFDALAQQETDFEKALAYYELSFEVAQLILKDIDTQEASVIHQLENRKRSEKCIALLFEAYKIKSDENLFKRAFTYAEMSKATVLKAVLSKKSLLERYPNDQLLQREQRLEQKQAELTHALNRLQLLNTSSNENQNLIAELNRLYLQRKEIRQQVNLKYPTEISDDFELSRVRAKLKKDKASMLMFFYGQNAVYSFRIEADSCRLEEKRLETGLEESVKMMLSFYDSPSAINENVNSYTKTAFELYQLLGIQKHSESLNLIVIPDGLLSFVPFEALLTQPTTSVNYSQMPFLLKRHMIAYNTSVELYLKSQYLRKEQQVLGVFPVFENSAQELRFSKLEAEYIESVMTSQMYMNGNASKTQFLKEAQNYSVLHLSTHASGGSLKVPAAIEFADDMMLVDELYALNFQPDLVVLSACETGVGKLLKGEGAMSIARGFQYAGAKNLLFSLWQVNDKATAHIMSDFYAIYNRTGSFFKANSNSKTNYLENENIPNTYKSPYYWSGFVYYGTLQERPKAYEWMTSVAWGIGILISSVFVTWFLVRIRKSKK